jgi:hypothetical protein
MDVSAAAWRKTIADKKSHDGSWCKSGPRSIDLGMERLSRS